MARPNEARLDLQALRNNLALAKQLAPQSKTVAVVKANAYGHGAVTVAGALQSLTDAFAVACIEEAIELREADIETPILLLQGVFSADEIAQASRHRLWLMIENARQLEMLEQAELPEPLGCWLKVDTGMHRLGIASDRVSEYYQRLEQSDNVSPGTVLCTHFASADNLGSDQTSQQIAEFAHSCGALKAPRSCANSPAVLAWPESHQDWIRPGYMLYGNSPFGTTAQHNADQLQPVMTLSSQITSLRRVETDDTVGYGSSWKATRPSLIATVTIGYGDGYPRSAKNGTPVLVNGQRAPLAGRVSMDMITIDVTDLPGAAIGDEVILWGGDLSVAEVAKWSDTIGYELLTRMPPRTPRVVSNP